MSTASNSTGSSSGKEGCRCIEYGSVLSSLNNRKCTNDDGTDGVMLTASGPCASYSYGSSYCLLHDVNTDPNCMAKNYGPGEELPPWCFNPWCYVDPMECMVESSQRAFRSLYFPFGSGVDVFYSYSTCGSTAEDWLYESNQETLGEVSMKAIAASYNIMPFVYKRDYEGNIPQAPGEEYYDINVPYEGVHINLVKSLQGISEGDFTIDYVPGSRASRLVHPSSPGTAAVQDVADGLVDIAIGPIWITGSRLKMTTFTMPIHQDRTVLVIPKPGTQSSLSASTQKVLAPFTYEVWGLLLGVILFTALLSVWFSGKRGNTRSGRIRKRVYARLAVDEFLQKGIFFCSAGVEQDAGASLPHKLLMFGFGFFILIAVSAYVANLAAFLTKSEISIPVGTIEDAVAQEKAICAHPALESDLELAWPDANFVFNREGKELYGIVEDYDAGKCPVMAVGKMDSLGDMDLMDMFCKRELFYTESIVIENPVGFPIRSELASGFSYWMYQGEKYHGISAQLEGEKYDAENNRERSCNVMLAEQDDGDDYAKIGVKNLFFPIMFFVGFAVFAALLQLYYECWLRTRSDGDRRSSVLVGRTSTLNLFANTPHAKKTGDEKYNFDSEDEEEAVQLPRARNTDASIVTGTLLSDSVRLDTFKDDGSCRTEKRRVSFDFPPHSAGRSNGAGEVALSDLDTGVRDKLDDFIACYQKMKRRNSLVAAK